MESTFRKASPLFLSAALAFSSPTFVRAQNFETKPPASGALVPENITVRCTSEGRTVTHDLAGQGADGRPVAFTGNGLDIIDGTLAHYFRVLHRERSFLAFDGCTDEDYRSASGTYAALPHAFDDETAARVSSLIDEARLNGRLAYVPPVPSNEPVDTCLPEGRTITEGTTPNAENILERIDETTRGERTIPAAMLSILRGCTEQDLLAAESATLAGNEEQEIKDLIIQFLEAMRNVLRGTESEVPGERI